MSNFLLLEFPWETQFGGTVGTMYYSLAIVVVMGLVLMSACLIERQRKLFYITTVVTLIAIGIVLFVGGWFWLVTAALVITLGLTAFIIWFVKMWGAMEDEGAHNSTGPN